MKFTIKLDKSNIEESFKKVMEEKLDIALNDIADFILSESDRILRQDYDAGGSLDTGFLANSGVSDKETFLRKSVGFGASYAPYVEFGTNPHFPPIEIIYQWVWRKRNDLKITFDKKKEVMFNGKLHNADILKVSWAIANNMAQKGTEAKPFFRPAYHLGKSKAEEFIKKAMEK